MSELTESGEQRSVTVTIVNAQGLHARPADLFVRTAGKYQAQVQIAKDGQRADGKSILSLLTLAAEQGTELTISAVGPDASQALTALTELVEAGFYDERDEQPDHAQ